MEITPEKIELVKDRTGVTEEEAKAALESNGGNVVDAIVSIEESFDAKTAKKAGVKKEELINKMKEVVKRGNISKVTVSRNGEKILNIPLTVGILGTVIAPWGVIAGTVAAMGFKCDITFTDDQNREYNLTEKAGEFYLDAKEKGEDVLNIVKDKALPRSVNDDISVDIWEDVSEDDVVEVEKAEAVQDDETEE